MGRATPANPDMLGQSSMENIVRPAIAEGNTSDMSEEPTIISSVDSDDEDEHRLPRGPKRAKPGIVSAEQKVELWRYNSSLVFKPGETVVSSHNLLE